MRISTKAQREAIQQANKESHLKNGYQLEVFEGLQIFTKHEPTQNKWYLIVYKDNSTNAILNYYYNDVQAMNKRIEQTKKNYVDQREWKEKRKSEQGVKITLATLKAFLNKNSKNIFIKELSRFDGMVDCVMNVKDDFSHVERREDTAEHDLGFSGCWLVGSSRDTISIYEDDIYTGFQVYNSCGSWIAATPKAIKEVTKPTQPEVKQGSVNIIEYGKGIAVIGETYAIKDKLKAIGGRFNKFLTCGAGWVFTSDKLEEIKTMLLSLKESKEVAKVEEVQEVSTEEIKNDEFIIISSPLNNPFNLEYFKIIWHEGKQTPNFEGAIFSSWDELQKAFYLIWDANERGNDGGYTKVKVEFKQVNQEAEIFRVDITNKTNNGDFNPSEKHIINYLIELQEEEEIKPQVVDVQKYNDLNSISKAANSGKVISLLNLFDLSSSEHLKAIN